MFGDSMDYLGQQVGFGRKLRGWEEQEPEMYDSPLLAFGGK